MSGLFDDDLNPRHGKSIPVGRTITEPEKTKLRMAISGKPEVFLKLDRGTTIDSSGKRVVNAPRDKAGLRGLVNYMGKEGAELTDEQGNIFSGDDLKHATEDWQGMRQTGGTRREVFHIILSMPSDTPRNEVKIAVERFAAIQFKGHQYLIAHHDDTDRPHAHIALKVMAIDGVNRLKPDRQDLQEWREQFALQMERVGIDAAATSRLDRLSSRRSVTYKEYRWAKAKGDDFLEGRLYNPLSPAIIDKARQRLSDADSLENSPSHGSDDDRKLAADIRSHTARQLAPRQSQRQQDRSL